MKINLTFEPEFDALYEEYASDKIKKNLLKIEGISEEKLDVGNMSQAYFTKNLADMSVDMNANANEEMSANNYQSEVVKGTLKIEGYYLLWRYAKKRFGLERANELIKAIWDGLVYFHDASGNGVQTPYCYSFSTAPIMLEGRPYGQLHSTPPNRADSFTAQVIEVCMDLSQEFAGAIAPSDFIVNYAYYSKPELEQLLELADTFEPAYFVSPSAKIAFLKSIAVLSGWKPEKIEQEFLGKDIKEAVKQLHRKRIVNDFQKLIHVLNNKFRVSGQSPFSNISLFCRENLKNAFDGYMYPDGSHIDVEYIMYLQKIFGEIIAKGDPKTDLPYRFPVVTTNLSVDSDRNIIDSDFEMWVAETNYKKGQYNIYANEGTKIAMCPLHKDTEVVVRNFKGIFKSRIGNLGQHDKEYYEVLHNGKFVNGRFIKTTTNRFVEITLSNGHKVVTTDNHLNVTGRGNIKSEDLVVGDLMPFGLQPLEGLGGSYNAGYVVGAFLGDGSISNDSVTFSLNNTSKKHVAERLSNYLTNELEAEMNVYEKETLLSLVTRSHSVIGLIKVYVTGSDAHTKGINPSVLERSISFRQGILDGYMATDGGNRGRIYTVSERMVSDLTLLVASLGNVTNVKISDSRDCRFGDSTVYCVKVYDRDDLMSRSYSGVWEQGDGNVVWFYVTDIKSVDKTSNAYCFEVDTDEHQFQLANGLITHNCRFINDVDSQTEFRADSFGNGGINIGSHRVVTVNLPRVALMSKDKTSFFDNLEYALNISKDLLVVHKEEILKRRIEAGFLKFFKPLGWFDVDTFFSTIGLVGVFEMCVFSGKPMETKEGKEFTACVLDFIRTKSKEFTKETGNVFNTEEIPAESTAIALARKDALFYPDYQVFKLYSNQYLPLIADVSMTERVKLTGKFMKFLSGGGILHMNIADMIKSPEQMLQLMRFAIKNGVEHFAVNYGFGTCVNGHTSVVGNRRFCPHCNAPIKDWLTRVIGYFTKVSSWNEVRRNYEFGKRAFKEVAND